MVLVDTAGRMQDNEPLMRALAKLVALNKPDLCLFVGEALVGNDSVDQVGVTPTASPYSDSLTTCTTGIYLHNECNDCAHVGWSRHAPPHTYAVQSRLPPRCFPAAAAHDDVVGF